MPKMSQVSVAFNMRELISSLTPPPVITQLSRSDNGPHTIMSTKDYLVDDRNPASRLNNSSTSTTNFSHLSLSSHATDAHYLSSRNVIFGLLKPRSKLHVGAYSVRIWYQIWKQASLNRILESRAINVSCVSEMHIQDRSFIVEGGLLKTVTRSEAHVYTRIML